jgi:hypothetical protein
MLQSISLPGPQLCRAVLYKIKHCRRVATPTTSSRPTTLHSSNLHPYAYGCALMSPRPSTTLADFDGR